MIDTTYDKYVTIVYNWSERKKTYTTVRVYNPRHEVYGELEFYVLGIGVSTFQEPGGYDPKKDWMSNPKLKQHADDLKDLIKYMAGDSWISIDDLKELSDELKSAGASEVYLHPAYWTDNKTLFPHFTPDEWLIVIPKDK